LAEKENMAKQVQSGLMSVESCEIAIQTILLRIELLDGVISAKKGEITNKWNENVMQFLAKTEEPVESFETMRSHLREALEALEASQPE